MKSNSDNLCRVFVDDSVHDSDDFVLTASVVTFDHLGPEVSLLLGEAGLIPGQDEYKSSSPKADDERSRRLRSQLVDLIGRRNVRIAIAITPRAERKTAGVDMLSLLARLRCEGALGPGKVQVCLDDGLMTKCGREWLVANPDSGLAIVEETDSRLVPELQLADLVASFAATIIRCELGTVIKKITPGPSNGYHPDEQFTLGFELWAGLRYNLASTRSTKSVDPDNYFESRTLPAFGLHVNPRCSVALQEAAEKRLGRVYLGCIH
ncbi:MAG: hypothetical protein P4L73_15995 [Caulobacteraceae bacterium]|nr:hypothetical protein [Caulobacteraceae bacterium]